MGFGRFQWQVTDVNDTTVTLSPSQEDIEAIGNDGRQIEPYTREITQLESWEVMQRTNETYPEAATSLAKGNEEAARVSAQGNDAAKGQKGRKGAPPQGSATSGRGFGDE